MTTTELQQAFRFYFAGKLGPDEATELLRIARAQNFTYRGSPQRRTV